MATDPVQIAAHHVQDANAIVLPFGAEIALPKIFGFQVTKYMALEVAAAVLMLLIFVPLAWKIRTGKPPRGRWWNAFEAVILFVRDQIVRPAIGGREADRYLPFILTLFFFILFCNLLGLIPWLGSPTGSINVTLALAAVAFAVVMGVGMKKHGPVKFWVGLCPPMDVPKPMAVVLVPMILSLEIGGLVIRHVILAVRLLANMFAGHLVVGVIVAFIPAVVGSTLWYGVAPASIFGATALNLLELFVAFLQAYVFAFLTAIFIGMSIHQH